jgi:hypothetical protein
MKLLVSVIAASAFALSAGSAFAACGHQSVKLEQTIASTKTAPVEEEAMTTYEGEEIKLPPQDEKSE